MVERFPKPIVFVSKCLGFAHCRYNGEIIPNKFVEKLAKYVEFKTACPEEAIGMGTPREPVRVIRSSSQELLYQPSTGKDWSSKMKKFSSEYLDGLGEVDGFILKHRSPSCGVYNAKVYDSKKAVGHRNGPGVFGSRVLERFGSVAVEDEGRLLNFTIRENFLIKIFTFARFRIAAGSGKVSGISSFHAQHKFLFLAYDESMMRKLGTVASNQKGYSFERLSSEYVSGMKKLFSKTPTPGSWINALSHMFGFFKSDLSSKEKVFFMKTLEEYRDERIPLSVLFRLIESWAIKYDVKYLLEQTILQPYPLDLIEITDSGKGRSKGRHL